MPWLRKLARLGIDGEPNRPMALYMEEMIFFILLYF
jgi:hypothetical protein